MTDVHTGDTDHHNDEDENEDTEAADDDEDYDEREEGEGEAPQNGPNRPHAVSRPKRKTKPIPQARSMFMFSSTNRYVGYV